MTKDNYGNDRSDAGFDSDSTHYSKYLGDDAYDDGSAGATEPIDAEIVDDYPAETAGTGAGYRGAHRREEDPAYEGDYTTEYAAGADEGGRFADDAVYEEPYEDQPENRGQAAAAEGGLPKRGLAMILIAVAALLALWGVWKMTQDDKDGNGEGAAPASSTMVGSSPAAPAGSPAQDPNAQAGQDGAQQAQDPNAQATATVTDTVRAGDPNAQAPQDQNAPRPEGQQDQQGQQGQPGAQGQPAPAPAGAPIDAASAQVFIYNNSGTPDLASRTADQLKGQYNVANNSTDAAVMNMPEQVYGVFPETYVFFDPSVPGAEQVAADIARRVGGAARAKGDIPDGAVSIPEQAANNRAAVAVVLAG
ncbi:hypothetical protein GC584_07980 [Corynebacterium sp. zg912]|uniref:LytR/CpsA/Psr regulator C-terminal domain-containing protein n=1 Tax=Corynebacterium wankanglinii TaxID=2735136 RepID=A0A7V9A2H9_9CORY|nr:MULTISPECIES: LytR C-terminal domain-containing protein [Corynebacterium]MBA1838178.1 hypothetical protein [Corynebacterium wankanglinii]MCR5929348.1 hypothetical protein [Corynebacterium sp. zg912]